MDSRLTGVNEEEDEESDLSENETDGGKKSGKNAISINAGKQPSMADDDDDDLSEVEEEEAKGDERNEGDDGLTARKLSSASKAKIDEAITMDGDGDNSDMDDNEGGWFLLLTK